MFFEILIDLGFCKQLIYRRFRKCGNLQYLRQFVHRVLAAQRVFDVRQDQVGTDRYPKMGLDGIFGTAPELLYLKVLFYPPEEHFYLPTVFIDGGDIHGRYLEIIRQEHQCDIFLHVPIFYPSQFFGVELLAFRPRQPYRLVTAQPRGFVDLP